MDPLKYNHEDEFWPLSGGEPYFSLILSRSQVKPSYNMTLPIKIRKAILYDSVPVMLMYRGKIWNMNYLNKRFDPKWRDFAIDNDLNAGDALVFEMVKRSKALVELRVQILRDDIPSEMLKKENGDTANAPIMIE